MEEFTGNPFILFTPPVIWKPAQKTLQIQKCSLLNKWAEMSNQEHINYCVWDRITKNVKVTDTCTFGDL